MNLGKFDGMGLVDGTRNNDSKRKVLASRRLLLPKQLALAFCPCIDRDPFDRMLVAQAQD